MTHLLAMLASSTGGKKVVNLQKYFRAKCGVDGMSEKSKEYECLRL
jgi:hypothetical protein